jgi:hypothetical protein
MKATHKDLHAEKKSHLTVATEKNIELHLEKKDFGGIKHKVGQKIKMTIPMVTTSVDKGHARFRQTKNVKPELPNDKIRRIVTQQFKAKKQGE